ncbi:MAG: 1-phosphofructokinase [Cardiobacteriaceae bacterium]|nr:1-phosphofructokinase [Cardiobacteriaceae bacterium]
MKIIAVTANPAIDLTAHAPDWKRGRVNRGQKIDKTPGGKGISVAVNLCDAGLSTIATGWLGEHNHQIFIEECARHKIIDRFIRIPGDTRRCIKIIDDVNGETTDINMPGKEIPFEAQQMLLNYLDTEVDDKTALVFGGSLPPGIATDFYAQMAKRYRSKCHCLMIDTSDKALVALMESDVLPHIIKPNIHELETICGRKIQDDEEIVQTAREFIARGVELAVISMGSHGAWFVNKDEAIHAAPIRVKVLSTVGAGDAMVAGTVRGVLLGQDLATLARTATAYSAANIQHAGNALPSKEEVQKLMNRVIISQLPE